MIPAYLCLAVFSIAGLIASVVCNILGWLCIGPHGGSIFFLLHLICLGLFLPLVVIANRTMPKPGRDNMKHLFAELPRWARSALGGLFAFAMLNFVYFLICTTRFPKGEVPSYLVLRGFSGHWMLFFGVSLSGYFALARLARKGQVQ
jgi:hypothetical protein